MSIPDPPPRADNAEVREVIHLVGDTAFVGTELAGARTAAVQAREHLDLREYADEGSPELSDYINEATEYARRHKLVFQLPAGQLELNDTWSIGTGKELEADPADPDTFGIYLPFHVRGGGMGVDGVNGTVLIAPFLDRPALNLQCCPGVVVEDLAVHGTFPPRYATTHEIAWAYRDLEDYYPVGWDVKRYAPYCGIGIGAFSNTNPSSLPGDVYPNQPSGLIASGTLHTIRNVDVRNFEVGIAISPNGSNGGLGTSNHIENCSVAFCTYSVLVGDLQVRNTNIINMLAGNATHTFLINRGGAVSVRGGEINGLYQLFNAYGGTLSLQEFSCEILGRLGSRLGDGGSLKIRAARLLIGCGGGKDYQKEPIIMAHQGTAELDGCDITLIDQPVIPTMNFLNDGQLQFKNCLFNGFSTIDRDFEIARGFPNYGGYPSFEMCRQQIGMPGGFADNYMSTSQPHLRTSTDNVFPRSVVQPSSGFVTSRGAAGSTTYRVDADRGYCEVAAISAVVWGASSVSFTATAGEFLIGDHLLGRLAVQLNDLGSPFPERAVPLLVVTNVVGTTVTAGALYEWDEIDQTATAPHLNKIVSACWAPYEETTGAFTGTWTTGTAITVGSIFFLRPRDFLRAAVGLPSIVRVVSIGADLHDVTLSKAVVSPRTNEPLFYGKLVPV